MLKDNPELAEKIEQEIRASNPELSLELEPGEDEDGNDFEE
jgi:hypothetical protein